jgi:hypothetical protein
VAFKAKIGTKKDFVVPPSVAIYRPIPFPDQLSAARQAVDASPKWVF